MQTKRNLFLCGFLDMLVFEETKLLTELRKKLLTKNKNKTKKNDSRSHAFFGPKTLNCQINISIWQKEWDETVLVCNKFHEILPKLPEKLLSFCNTRKENTVLNLSLIHI